MIVFMLVRVLVFGMVMLVCLMTLPMRVWYVLAHTAVQYVSTR